MTVVNYSVQDTFGNNQFFWAGLEWFDELLHSERLHNALGRQITFSLIMLAIEVPLVVTEEHVIDPHLVARRGIRRLLFALHTEYLVRRDSALGVFIAADGRARFLPLQGAAGGPTAVLQNQAGNALIIVDGRFGMDDGDQVKIVER